MKTSSTNFQRSITKASYQLSLIDTMRFLAIATPIPIRNRKKFT